MNRTFTKVHILTMCMVIASFLFALLSFSYKEQDGDWEYLLDGQLSEWDVYMGVPHYTVDLKGHEKGDGKKGTPIGLNRDPLNVFSVALINNEPVLKVTGEVYAGLSTKKKFENYHLSMMFRWGNKKYEPRLGDRRDSGILYHAQEPHGQFWNAWMKAPEMQVQEGDCGDFHPLVGVSMDIRASEMIEEGVSYLRYDPKGNLITFKSGGDNKRCRRIDNYEKETGEWNHLELICIGDKAYHIVNGKVVMVLENSRSFDQSGNSTTLTKGKIQIQSEAAEVYYKDIKIRQIDQVPEIFTKQLD
jgi:hypothetical protein